MRIVVKIGTNLLTRRDGSLDTDRIRSLAAEIAAAKKAGAETVLVTSGAIGAGMGKMGVRRRPSSLKEKQAFAAVGQPVLMDAYGGIFGALGLSVAQVLLTRQDFDERQRYLNARNTLLTLLGFGVIPVINENDTVAVEEINFGDNDTLAAVVAAKISADTLVLLTDVDGLYRDAQKRCDVIPVVDAVTPEIERCASGVSGSGKGVGGMKTKINAAKIATAAGVTMIIANGACEGVIGKVVRGEPVGTLFAARRSLEARKCWIAYGTKHRGKITVDEGAARALVERGKSLLPSGVIGVQGDFRTGDPVSILDPGGREIARGLASYSSHDIALIKGKKTGEIKKVFNGAGVEEVVHRDNLVIL